MYPQAPVLRWRDGVSSPSGISGCALPVQRETHPQSGLERKKLDAARLEKLLATLHEELRDAAILPDDRRCLEVVETIDHVDGKPQARVRRMVNALHYQELLARLDALVGSRSE
jgi:hypothetical protein